MIANALQMGSRDRTIFLFQVASFVDELSIEYNAPGNIADHMALAISNDFVKQSRQLRHIEIGRSAALYFLSLYLKALTTEGDEAFAAQSMCEMIFARTVAEVAAIIRDMDDGHS